MRRATAARAAVASAGDPAGVAGGRAGGVPPCHTGVDGGRGRGGGEPARRAAGVRGGSRTATAPPSLGVDGGGGGGGLVTAALPGGVPAVAPRPADRGGGRGWRPLRAA